MASWEKSEGRRLRSECLSVVDDLDIPVPFQLQSFCDRVAQRRERPLYLRPVTLPPGSPTGMCVSTRATDYIFYEVSTSSLHQEHIVLHEIGHLLWGHLAAKTRSEQALQLLLPALDTRAVTLMLERGECTGTTERQAELVATLIMQRAVRRQPSRVLGEDAETITRLSRTLENPGDQHG